MHLEHHEHYARHRDGLEKEEQRLGSHNLLETTGDSEEPKDTIQQEEEADRRLHAAGRAEEVVGLSCRSFLKGQSLARLEPEGPGALHWLSWWDANSSAWPITHQVVL